MKITELKHLGLTEKEAKVYLATLELGYASVQGIARKAGTNRVAVYAVLDNLKIRGLIDTTYKGKRKVYVAARPESLLELLKEKQESIKTEIERYKLDLLPELESLYNRAEEKPKIRFFDLEEGLKLMWSELEKSKEKEVYGTVSLSVLPEKYRDPKSHIETMRKKGKSYYLTCTYRDDVKADKERMRLFPHVQYIALKKVDSYPPCGIYANDGKIYIVHYINPPFLVYIENEAIYEAIKFQSKAAVNYYKSK